MRNRIIAAASAFTLGLGLTAATAGSASAEPSGTYEYVCVSTTGSSYSMAQGEKLSNCKGSYLQKYINGKQIESVPLDGSGRKVDPDEQITGACIIAIAAGGTFAIINPPAGLAGAVSLLRTGVGALEICTA